MSIAVEDAQGAADPSGQHAEPHDHAQDHDAENHDAANQDSTDQGSEPQWLSGDQQRSWRAFLDATRLINERLQRQLAEQSDLSLAEYEILVRLSEAPDRRLRMSELADQAVHSRSRLTHTVNRLESRGLVLREACEDDGRGINATLTERGFGVLAAAAPGHVAAVRGVIFDHLEDVDVAALTGVLTKILGGLRPSA